MGSGQADVEPVAAGRGESPPRRKRLLLKTAEGVLADRERLAALKNKSVSAGYKQPQYTYHALADTTDSLRLFRFVPSDRTNEIACELSEHRLSDLPVYQALSYEWGSAIEVTWIRVNGKPFRIQTNLFVFLQKVRSVAKRNQWFFADAICVDQGEIHERNGQVMLMGRIYSGAQGVLTWLGAAANDSDELYQMHRTAPTLTRKTLCGALVDIFHSSYLISVTRALVALANRSYWSRIWIVQEVLLAHDITIFCGNWTVSWDEFEQLLALPSDLYKMSGSQDHSSLEYLEQELKHCRLASFVATRRINFGAALILPMPDMIEAYGQSACTDLRDRVYGLLGIARSSPDGYRLEVDYAQNEVSLFFDVLQCYQVAYPVRFGTVLNSLLRLDLSLSCASFEQLTDHVDESIYGSIGSQSLRVELEYAGQVVPIDTAPVASTPFSEADVGPVKMFHVSTGRSQSSDECLFTCAPAENDDYIVRILHSDYVFIYRITTRSIDEVELSKRFDPYSYQKRELIGRGVLLRPGLANEATRFVEKDFHYCEHENRDVYELVSSGARALISTGASDMLVVTTSLDDSRKWQGHLVSDGPKIRKAPTGHTAVFREMEKYRQQMKTAGKMEETTEDSYMWTLNSHRAYCRFEDCDLKKSTHLSS